MKDKGITLVELIVVISTIGILAVALGFTFQGWMGAYNVESQVKQMYVDLMNTRARAMQRNRVHFVTFATTQYTIQEDISPWPDGDGNLTADDNTRPTNYNDPIPLLQENLDTRHPITWSDIADTQVNFTDRGLSNEGKTICVFSDVNPDYDCIVISQTRINLGKIITQASAGGQCSSANCNVK